MEKYHLSIKIYGRVQGVSFRYWAWMKARIIGVCGFVQNKPDGTVYIEAEGEKNNLEKLLKWCHAGSPSARVERIDYAYSHQLKDFNKFEIRK